MEEKIIITWRQATEKEIQDKLDSKENPGMIEVSRETVNASDKNDVDPSMK